MDSVSKSVYYDSNLASISIVVTEWATGVKDYGDYSEGKINGKRTLYQ